MAEDDNYYPSGDEGPTAEGSEPTDKGDMAETATLPKSFFQGKDKEPGDRCEVEVVRVLDDEVEVKYIPHKDKEETKEEDMGHGEAFDAAMA